MPQSALSRGLAWGNLLGFFLFFRCLEAKFNAERRDWEEQEKWVVPSGRPLALFSPETEPHSQHIVSAGKGWASSTKGPGSHSLCYLADRTGPFNLFVQAQQYWGHQVTQQWHREPSSDPKSYLKSPHTMHILQSFELSPQPSNKFKELLDFNPRGGEKMGSITFPT